MPSPLSQLRPAVMTQPEYRQDRCSDEEKPRDKNRHRIAMRKGLLSSCPFTRPSALVTEPIRALATL